MAGRRFRLGQDCLCRRDAPALGRFTFPICWRCTGMAAGAVAMLASRALRGWPAPCASLAAAGCLCALPAAADVTFQVMTSYRSNRLRRLATGLLLGAGIVLFAHVLVGHCHGFP
jgi:uncharacterized membrane protein